MKFISNNMVEKIKQQNNSIPVIRKCVYFFNSGNLSQQKWKSSQSYRSCMGCALKTSAMVLSKLLYT